MQVTNVNLEETDARKDASMIFRINQVLAEVSVNLGLSQPIVVQEDVHWVSYFFPTPLEHRVMYTWDTLRDGRVWSESATVMAGDPPQAVMVLGRVRAIFSWAELVQLPIEALQEGSEILRLAKLQTGKFHS
jgi:hypothetical protein